MRRLALLCAPLLALTACSYPFHRTVSMRIYAHGHDKLYSQIRMGEHRADFRCIASITGTCHYIVYARSCRGHDQCNAALLRHYDIPAGKQLFDSALPAGYAACVSQGPDDKLAACPRIR